jgi:hypothetical protein
MLQFISEIYLSHINLFVIVLALTGFYFLLKRPLYAFYLAVFTIPFKSLYLWVGTNIELWKILSAASLVTYGPSLVLKSYNRLKSNRYFHMLVLYIAYGVAMTLLFLFIIPGSDKHTVIGGFFKNEGRFIYQIVLFLITMNLVLWPIYVIKNEEQLLKVFRVIVLAAVVLAICGVVQDFSIRLSGFDPFPIHRPTGFDYEGGSLVVTGMESRQRMNSLAGEPKHLAIAMIVAFVVVLLHRLNGKKIICHDFIVMALFLACLVETYSATGYIWYGVSMVMIMVLYSFKLSRSLLALIVASAMTMIVVYYTTGGEPTPYIIKTLNKTGLEIQDEAVMGFFRDNPFMAITGLGLGNIHFYADKYLPYGFPIFHDTPFKGNTGFFFLLGDVGLIGIALLMSLTAGLVRSSRKLAEGSGPASSGKHNMAIHFTLIAGVLFLLRQFEIYYVSLGLLLYLHNDLRSRVRKSSVPLP